MPFVRFPSEALKEIANRNREGDSKEPPGSFVKPVSPKPLKKQFYFKEDFRGSRKLVVHSEDCISTVQIMYRDPQFPVEVSIHMRSSEVTRLLPLDLFNILVKVVGGVSHALWEEKRLKEEPRYNFTVLIGSAHFYLNGDKRRNG